MRTNLTLIAQKKIICISNRSFGQTRFCPNEMFIPLVYSSQYDTLLGLEKIKICAGGSSRSANLERKRVWKK